MGIDNTHTDIASSVSYERGLNKCKTTFTKEDKLECHVNEWVMNWVKKYHPKAFDEAREFVSKNINLGDEE
jgi:hypothetical protein